MDETPRRLGRARFGVFEVDLRARELRKHGLKIRLQEQPFQVLEMLLEKPRELVTREELRNKLWPADTFVDFDQGLNKAINKIRDALGDSAENPRFIETLARHGYRFIADVATMDRAPADSAQPRAENLSGQRDRDRLEQSGTHETHTRAKWPLSWNIASLALVLVLAILALWIFHWKSRTSSPIRSLAVLPLESLSSDASQDYFSDGMTDELITDLGQIGALRVISRTSVMSYKHVRKPLRQIARELNVDAVVEGTVLRFGDQVRITAQLIRARDDRHLWAQSYQGNLRDTLVLQNRVARDIADQIRISLSPREQAVLKNVKVVNPDAYEDYLRGRYFWNKRTNDGLKKALDYFDQAIAKDPTYARAYSGLADTYALLGDWQYAVMPPKEALPRAKAAAIKALELDNTLGEAHTSLAFCLEGFDWDWESAESEFKQGIALNPGYATAHHWYAWYLSLLGRNDEAIAEMKKAENLDPLSLIIGADMAEVLLIARRYDESILQSRRTIEMDSAFALAHNQLGQAYLQKGMRAEAIAEFQAAVRLSAGSPNCTANLGRAYALAGNKNAALDLLQNLKRRSNSGYSNAAEIAVIYAALGDNDQAMAWLERGYQERFNPGALIRPGFDPLRSDPRFQQLMRRIGLPQQSLP